MENTEAKQETAAPAGKTVKAVPSSPVYAMFDLAKIDGKDIVVGSIGFRDQFGMERMAKTAGEKGVMNLGKQVLAIFYGRVDVIEPDDETKAKIAAEDAKIASETKDKILNAYEQPGQKL